MSSFWTWSWIFLSYEYCSDAFMYSVGNQLVKLELLAKRNSLCEVINVNEDVIDGNEGVMAAWKKYFESLLLVEECHSHVEDYESFASSVDMSLTESEILRSNTETQKGKAYLLEHFNNDACETFMCNFCIETVCDMSNIKS